MSLSGGPGASKGLTLCVSPLHVRRLAVCVRVHDLAVSAAARSL